LPGDGTAWFDGLTIELDRESFADPSVLDLDFESAGPRGFYTGGAGYRVAVDASVARSGKQSLRMQYVGPSGATASAATSPTEAAARWKAVISHLDEGRAGQVSRDRSMADNVKWILDQNPGAKIVLWAHNGHVAAEGFSYETMGAALRRIYGNEMVVFGLAFNQGSFQAIRQGGGGLTNFTVPPAPPGSLDATLAAARVPLFALDLRAAPEWLRQPRGSRQIGAIYPEGQPYAFIGDIVAPKAYDAVLFVEATTVARKNPGR
jgi:erythromycin esterase